MYYADPSDATVFDVQLEDETGFTIFGSKNASGLLLNVTSVQLKDENGSITGTLEFDQIMRISTYRPAAGGSLSFEWDTKNSEVTVRVVSSNTTDEVLQTVKLGNHSSGSRRLANYNHLPCFGDNAYVPNIPPGSLVNPARQGKVTLTTARCGIGVDALDYYDARDWIKVQLWEDAIIDKQIQQETYDLRRLSVSEYEGSFPYEMIDYEELAIRELCRSSAWTINCVCTFAGLFFFDPTVWTPFCLLFEAPPAIERCELLLKDFRDMCILFSNTIDPWGDSVPQTLCDFINSSAFEADFAYVTPGPGTKHMRIADRSNNWLVEYSFDDDKPMADVQTIPPTGPKQPYRDLEVDIIFGCIEQDDEVEVIVERPADGYESTTTCGKGKNGGCSITIPKMERFDEFLKDRWDPANGPLDVTVTVVYDHIFLLPDKKKVLSIVYENPCVTDPCFCNPCLCNPCICDPCTCYGFGCGGATGDPHLVTFDGLSYDCQGHGDFVLIKGSSGLQVQARFEKPSPLQTFSFARGIATRSDAAASVIQISLNSANALELLVNGTKTNVAAGYEDEHYRVAPSANRIFMKASNVTVGVQNYWAALNVYVSLPPLFSSAHCGLLGTRDNNASNDWTTSDCTPIDVPTGQTQLRYQPSYDYCVSNWCIRNAQDSLFTYSDSFPALFDGCEVPYGGAVDLTRATPQLNALCGQDIACLTDGIEIGVDAAVRLLEAESVLLGSGSLLQASPSGVVVGRSVNVELTVNLNEAASIPQGLDSFAVYRINSETRELGSSLIARLLDTGSGFGQDSAANDRIYSNVVAIQSSVAGESYGFKAVPVLNGVEDPDSALAIENLQAVRSYAEEAGLGENGNFSGLFAFENATNLVLIVDYTWPMDKSDLDTRTSFLGRNVGFRCGSGDYMNWLGDEKDNEGIESVEIRVGDALADGAWTGSVSINLSEGWHGSSTKGAASVTVRSEPGANVLSFAVLPGRQSGCAITVVGRIDVNATVAGGAMVTVVKTSA
jgi:hypothetical protein